VIEGAVPDAVSVSGPLRGMAAADDVKCCQIAVPALVPSVTWVLSPAVSVTVAAFSRVRSATAAGGRVTAILVPVGLSGWPTVPAAGKVALTCVLTGRDPEGNAQA
jgi:hypothetical protein